MKALMVAIGSCDPDRVSRLTRAIPEEASVRLCSSPDLLIDTVAREMPELVLVDLGMAETGTPAFVHRVHDSCQESRILAVGRAESNDMKVELFAAGARGWCKGESEASVLRRAIEAVARGEMWIDRVLFGRIVDRLSRVVTADRNATRRTGPAPDPRLADLTSREVEVVNLVTRGSTNKEIAHRLAITERTVKAHLTRIYQKLGVDDRVKLVLLLGRSGSATP